MFELIFQYPPLSNPKIKPDKVLMCVIASLLGYIGIGIQLTGWGCRQIYNMNKQPSMKQISNLLNSNPNLQEFESRLQASSQLNNPCYLGLLLMSIVSMPAPKIQYIRTLINYGADVNFMEPAQSPHHHHAKSVLMIACQNSVAQNVRFLLTREDLQVGAMDVHGENALHYALRNPSQEEGVQIIHIILKQFPHLIKAHPKSYLFSAIESQKIHIIEFLLTNYVDPNEQTQPVGLTALQFAISLADQLPSHKIKQIIIVLLKHGADSRRQNFLSQDSYDYADRYLFDLEQLVSKHPPMVETQKTRTQKCFTVCTYEDTGTTYSKDEDCFNVWDDKKQEELLGDAEGQLAIQKISLICQRQQQVIDETPCSNNIAHFSDEQESSNQQQQISLEQFHHKFSEQMVSHSSSYISQYNKAGQDIAILYSYLQNVGYELELKLQVIGSFATQLWTLNSDIDLVYINQKSSFVPVGKQLQKIHKQIRSRYRQLGISQIFLNLDSNFPNIKIKMNEQHNERKLEISIFQRKCSGRKYVQFINQYINYYPNIIPVFYFLHHLLETFNLHKPTKNGLKTYTIFLIILTVLQYYNCESMSISELLINLIYYYNNCYEYSLDKINGCGEYKAIFNMMDPLNRGNNTGGKDTDTERLRTMFKVVGYAFEGRLKEMKVDGLMSQIFELHRMFQ